MISFIKGTIKEINKSNLTILTSSGVGYEINMPSVKLEGYIVGQEAEFYTYLKISDNNHALFGFENTQEKSFFILLLTVSGVGPKSAMNILNLGSMDDISSAIGREDVKYLTSVQGLGQKTAERLVVELKSKVSDIGLKVGGKNSQVLADVVDGLTAMGYGKEEVKQSIKDLDAEGKTTEELLKLILQRLSK